MATDLYQAGATYYENTTTVDYTGSYTNVTSYPTVTIYDLGPGYPGPTENYVNSDGEFSLWWENPEIADAYEGAVRYTGGDFFSFTTDAYVRPGGGSVTQPITVADGTTTQISYSLDVLIREGVRVTGGESFTVPATARIIAETGTDTAWSDVIGLYDPTTQGTSIVLAGDAVSNVLTFSVFDADIPSGATVTGMTVVINRTVISGSVAESGTVYRCAFQ